MAYLVLARKYRPERFSEMIGQEHVTRTLANAIASGRVHHAYLFCGVRGLGKTSAARILARGLVCEQGPSPDPCNVCSQCQAVLQGRSVDVREIDGASNNSVEDIRQLREQVHYLPQSARRKIYIIDEVHMLSASAFNALLKTLEEPPEHVTFIFATTDPHKVLPTILSRVSRLDFRRVKLNELVAHLQRILASEGFSVEIQGLELLGHCAEGSVRDALTLLDKVIAFAADPKHITAFDVQTILGQADREAIFRLVAPVLKGDAAAALTQLDQLLATTGDLSQLTVAILQHLRDLNVVRLGGDVSALIDGSASRHERLAQQAASLSPTRLSQLFDRFARAVEKIDRSKAPRLSLEMAVLDLATAEEVAPISSVIDELKLLARGKSSPARGGAPSAPASNPAPGRPSGSPAGSASFEPAKRAQAPSPAPQTQSRPTPSQAYPPIEHEGGAPLSAFGQELSRMLMGNTQNSRSAATSHAPAPPEPPPGGAPRPFAQADLPTSLPARSASQQSPNTPPAGINVGATLALATASAPTALPRLDWEVPEHLARFAEFVVKLQNTGDLHLLAALLADAGIIRFDSGGVEICLGARSFHQQQFSAGSQNYQAFLERLGEHFGALPKITVHDRLPDLDAAPSIRQAEEVQAAAFQARLELEAQADARIRGLLSSFEGKIRGVVALTPAPKLTSSHDSPASVEPSPER